MPTFRKVIKTGNSLAITIPSKTISEFSLKEGDIAAVEINQTLSTITYLFTGHPKQLSLIKRSK